MRKLSRAALAGLPALVATLAVMLPVAWAQETEAHPAFVYGINAAVPGSYVGTFAPATAETIYLLAGQTSVISPRRTEIYFWPITNEYRADWHALNEAAPGTLELSRNGAVVAELTPTDYTIHFRQEDGATSAELFLGQAAVDAEADFRARQQAFQEASAEYYQAEREWLDAAAEANRRAQAGESVEPPPAPPELPDPIGVFSNGLSEGIPIALEPGQYQIRLRGDDGAVVQGSERGLIVFAPRREGIGYTVVPETRWTTPLESPAPNDVIYGETGATLYLEPHVAREYPALAWARLQNPQRQGIPGSEWEWVNGERLTDATLEVLEVAGGRVGAQRDLTPYQVKQIPGAQLGYEVLPYDADAEGAPAAPDFAAYPIQLAAGGEQFDVRLVSAQGEVISGSVRQVRAAGHIPLNRLVLLPLAPLALGALVSGRRRASVSRRLAE